MYPERGIGGIGQYDVFHQVFLPGVSGGKPAAQKRYTLLFAMANMGWFTLGAW
jgi:hypothetical protein